MIAYEEDLQELDELEEDASSQTEEENEEIGPERRKIFTDKSDPQLEGLYSRFKSGDLVLDPIFQRRKVWDDLKSCRLVESILLEVPLPVFYLAESNNGTEEVIDGQQRFTAIFRYLDNEYPLRGLKALDKFNGKYFKDLDKPIQKIIRNYTVRTVTFQKESDPNLRFDIFERLNTGAVPLNPQELRNCIYRGKYNDLLIQLSKDSDYMFLMGLKTPERRMRDVEYVLRFAAFFNCTYLKYKPSMARFLNEDMLQNQSISDIKAKQISLAFKNSVTLIRSLLGQHAFKRFYRGDNANSPNGYWERNKFNASLYDILMFSFADKDKNQIMSKLDSIREAFIALMTENQEFIDSIELSTSATKMVHKRFDIWRKTLDSILEDTTKQPRIFSRELKIQLYDSNPTCSLCGQHISELDDSAIDHIEQYWLGGRTIPENARLTHRFCNWSRPRRDTVNT